MQDSAVSRIEVIHLKCHNIALTVAAEAVADALEREGKISLAAELRAALNWEPPVYKPGATHLGRMAK